MQVYTGGGKTAVTGGGKTAVAGGGKIVKQAGAELCQAQFKLGLAKTVLPDVEVGFHEQIIEIVFYLLKY